MLINTKHRLVIAAYNTVAYRGTAFMYSSIDWENWWAVLSKYLASGLPAPRQDNSKQSRIVALIGLLCLKLLLLTSLQQHKNYHNYGFLLFCASEVKSSSFFYCLLCVFSFLLCLPSWRPRPVFTNVQTCLTCPMFRHKFCFLPCCCACVFA